MHKIFDKNTVKVSHSCMKNMGSIISGQNYNILNPKQNHLGVIVERQLSLKWRMFDTEINMLG